MSKKAPDSIRDQWKERVINQSKSGLSIAAWCRQNNNISPRVFYYWRNELFPQSPINRDDFKEVSVQQNMDAQARNSGVCLQYQEFRILLDQQFDVNTLRQCLKALRGLPC